MYLRLKSTCDVILRSIAPLFLRNGEFKRTKELVNIHFSFFFLSLTTLNLYETYKNEHKFY
jgi:hypothetical protein